jgi:hypothetical protein
MASSTKVEVAFELTVGDTPYFRLNSATKGRLNNTDFRLGGPIWIDITDKVAAVNVKRGKNRELERYNAGSAGVRLHNEDRTFDPLNTSSPYVGNIIPRRGIRVTTASFPRFTGLIEDWNLDYDVSGKSDASIVAADAFTLLAQQSLTAGTATAQTTGERVEAVLSMPTVAWPLQERIIDEGSAQVGSDVFDTQESALTYLQKVEASEQGQLFMDRQGNVRFVNGAVTPTSDLSTVFFSDQGNGVPYTHATVSYGTELLYNQVTVESPLFTASRGNVESQEEYGITTTDVSTLLSTSNAVESLALFWVAKYGEPEYRFQDLTVSLEGLTGSQAEDVLNVELGDIVQISFTPNGIGSAINRYGQVNKIEDTITADRHTIVFGFGSLQFSFLVLDDTGFGILDSNVLAF